MKDMNKETQNLIKAFNADQDAALASDLEKIRENAASEVEKKIDASDLAEDLKKPLSDFVRAKLTN